MPKSEKRAEKVLQDKEYTHSKDHIVRESESLAGGQSGSGSTRCFTDDPRSTSKKAKKSNSCLNVDRRKGRRHISSLTLKKRCFASVQDPELQKINHTLKLKEELKAMTPQLRYDAKLLWKEDYGGIELTDDEDDVIASGTEFDQISSAEND